MFVVNLTVLYFILGIESVLWRRIFLKICAFVHHLNVAQQHNLQRQTQKKRGSLLTAMIYWHRSVNIVDVVK
jgi:hypothetical protein